MTLELDLGIPNDPTAQRPNSPRARKPILSPTKLATYLECAVKYRYIYLDRIGRWYLKARGEYSFGSTLHRVIQSFHEEGAVRTAAETVDLYEESFLPVGYTTPEERDRARAEGAQILKSYHEAAIERLETGIEPVLIEESIKLDMGPFYLGGRVDRVDRHPDGSLEIIDYKSGRWETTPQQVAGNLAMNVYQLILRRQNPAARVYSTIHCLRSGIRASAEMTHLEAADFAANILVIGQEIIARDFENIEPVEIEACPDCEFSSRCRRFWRWKAQNDSIVD